MRRCACTHRLCRLRRYVCLLWHAAAAGERHKICCDDCLPAWRPVTYQARPRTLAPQLPLPAAMGRDA